MNEAVLDTKQRILDAAECLFAERGVTGTSLRAVIAEANVNLAAVHYHFGSKDSLVKAVIHRRIDPVNQERLAMLTKHEAEAGEAGPTLRKIIESFINPSFRFCEDCERGEVFMVFIGRMLAEPDYFLGKVAPRQFRQIRERYVAALGKALPQVPPTEIFWRMMFAVGAMAHALRIGSLVTVMSGCICNKESVELTTRRLVDFIVAGLQAPVSEVSK